MLGDVVGGRFRVDQEVATGGMGVIYRCTDLTTGDPVAIKRLWLPSPRGRERFEREASLLATLSHPHIVRYVAHGEDRDQPFLAMEWIEGETLAKYVARQRPTMVEAVALVGVLAETLGFAHAEGVIHRDVKPANVMLVDGDPTRPKLVDFGLARELDGEARLTESGVVAGTYRYMAPEQARGHRDVDARADVYSLTTVLFELVTGARVFDGADPTELMLKLLCAEPPRIAQLLPAAPPALDRLVARGLSRAADQRPRDGAELARELRSIAADIAGGFDESTDYLRLTGEENRVVSILLVDVPARPLDQTVDIGPPRAGDARTTVDRAAAAHGGRAMTLRDGRCVVLVASDGSPREHVIRSARCALALRRLLPGIPLALATGRAEGGRHPTTESIERLCALRSDPAHGVAIDEATEALLPKRFELAHVDGAAYVRFEPADTAPLAESPVVFGRKTERRLLAAHLEACSEDREARAVALIGEPGIGKTHLLRATLLDRDPGTVWRGRADPMATATPFALLGHVLRGLLPDDDHREELDRLKALAPGLDLEALGLPLGAPVESLDDFTRATLADPASLAEAVGRATESLAERYLAGGLLVLAVDDLERADPPSMRVLRRLLTAHRAQPLLLIYTASEDSTAPIAAALGVRVEEVHLGRLSERACAEWIALSHANVSAKRARAIAEWSGGIPMHLDELLRIEAERPGDPLAPSVSLLLQASLERFPSESRLVLQVASVFGDAFDPEGVAHVLSVPVENVSAILAELAARGLIVREASHRFRNAALRSVAYAMLTEGDRERAHRRAGQFLRRRGASPALIAHHYAAAGAEDRLGALWLAAARDAMAADDASTAAELAQRAAQGELTDDARVEALLLEGRARAWGGALTEARALAREAMRLAEPASDPWWTALSRLTLRDGSQGERDRFDEVAEIASGALGDVVSPSAYVSCVSIVGAGVEVRSLERAAALDARLHRCRIADITELVASGELYARSRRAILHGALDVFLRTIEEIARACEQRRDRMRLELMLRERGQVLSELGLPGEAIESLGRSEALATGLGRPLYAARARLASATAHLRLGDLTGAREIVTPLCDGSAPAYEQTRGQAWLVCAELSLADDDPAAATLALERARALLPDHTDDDHVALDGLAARAALARGDLAAALAAAEHAVERAQARPVIFVSDAAAYLALRDARAALGDAEAARAARTAGAAALRGRAEAITDAALRERLLDRPLHRELRMQDEATHPR